MMVNAFVIDWRTASPLNGASTARLAIKLLMYGLLMVAGLITRLPLTPLNV